MCLPRISALVRCAVGFAQILLAPATQAETYTLTLVAQTGHTVKGRQAMRFCESSWQAGCIYAGLTLNDNQVLAFKAITQRGAAIMTRDSLLVESGDRIDGAALTSLDQPTLNNGGTLTFLAAYTSSRNKGEGVGIFTATAMLATTGQSIGGKTVRQLASPSRMSSQGQVAFWARYEPDGRPGVANLAGSLVEPYGPIAQTALLDCFCTPHLPLSMNNAGTVTFHSPYSGGQGGNAIFTQSSQVAAPGQTVAGVQLVHLSNPAINQGGTIAFRADFTSGGSSGNGVFTASQALAKTGSSIGGLTLYSIGPRIGLNDYGKIVFTADTQSADLVPPGSTAAVFTATGVVAKPGDMVGTRRISRIAPFSVVINNPGQIAFLAILEDGTEAVVLANQVP